MFTRIFQQPHTMTLWPRLNVWSAAASTASAVSGALIDIPKTEGCGVLPVMIGGPAVRRERDDRQREEEELKMEGQR